HLNRIGIPVQETLCRKCGEADETAKHVIFECPALQSKHSRSLGVLMHTEEGLEQESIVQKISWFFKGLGFDTACRSVDPCSCVITRLNYISTTIACEAGYGSKFFKTEKCCSYRTVDVKRNQFCDSVKFQTLLRAKD
ncbi:hypothetical protein J6590_056155, partial [Homalodisca vitripennis]